MPVDLHEKRQLDLASRVATVKAHTRPWRSIIALVLAVIAAIASVSAGQAFHYYWSAPGHLVPKLVHSVATAAFCILGVAAVIGLSGKARDVLQPMTGSAHAAVVRYTIVLLGGVTTLAITLALLHVPVGQFVVGGALTTILIGIAAQQSLGNVFAGMVLLLSRPFAVGDTIRLRSGALGGLIDGTVTEIGITYVSIDAADGLLHLPNSQVLAAAVGPLRSPAGSRDGTDTSGLPMPPAPPPA